MRLLGVGVSGLEPSGAGQRPLFEDAAESKTRRATLAADVVRQRMGDDALTRARLIRPRRKKGDAADEASSLPSVD